MKSAQKVEWNWVFIGRSEPIPSKFSFSMSPNSKNTLLRGTTYTCHEELGAFKPSFHHHWWYFEAKNQFGGSYVPCFCSWLGCKKLHKNWLKMAISNGFYWYFFWLPKLKMTKINDFFHYSIIPNPFDKYSVVKRGNISVLPT